MTENTRPIRLVFGHNGVDAYDRLFLNRLALEFDAFLVTFVSPTVVLEGARVIKLPDFGRPLRTRRLNNLRIAAGTLWRILHFRLRVRRMRARIVIGNWVTTYGLYASLCGLRPFVLFAYGSDIMVEPYRSFVHRWLTMRVIRSADLVVVDSEVQRRALLSLGGLPGKTMCFPWIDLKDMSETVADRTLRNKLNWNDKIVVVSVRKHEPIYAVDTLIRAIPIVLARSSDVRFMVFGSGTQTSRLIRLAEELKAEQFVHFSGTVPRDKLLAHVKGCDIYVSTSLSDGTSSSLVEAMVLGVPVVVTSITGNAEWISDNVNGLMFQEEDSEGLARIIIDLARNSANRDRLAAAAMKHLRERVKWETASAELIRRMRDLLI